MKPLAIALALLPAAFVLGGCAIDPVDHRQPRSQADAFETTPDVRQADARQRLTDALEAIYADSGRTGPWHYYSAFVDLNGDGRREALAYVVGPDRCSDGCDLYVLAPHGDRFDAISRIPAARTPLYVLHDRHRGWRDLSVATLDDAGGSADQRMAYAGSGYMPVPGAAPSHGDKPLISGFDGPGHRLVITPHGGDRDKP